MVTKVFKALEVWETLAAEREELRECDDAVAVLVKEIKDLGRHDLGLGRLGLARLGRGLGRVVVETVCTR